MIGYEIFVQSFADGNADGIGDFKGLEQKLNYLIDLGIDHIWLMPIHPSPSYHKYDVTDYFSIHEDYGTSQDFENFLGSAHFKGIKVIIDLVINHSSHLHPIFLSADFQEYYIVKHYDEVKHLIKKDHLQDDSDNQRQWHQYQKSELYYYGYFSEYMPEFDYNKEKTRVFAIEIAKFWLNIGVDGFRIDAAKHIFEHENDYDKAAKWWEYFKENLEVNFPDVILIGEVWDHVDLQQKFTIGLTSMFNFDLSWAIKQSCLDHHPKHFREALLRNLNMENNVYRSTFFLTNHDQNRIASELKNERLIKFAASVLMLQANPVFIYYGEEIGTLGMKPDEHLREPINWGDEFTTNWITAKYTTEKIYLLCQKPNSIYKLYQTLIQLKKEYFDQNSNISQIIKINKNVLKITFTGKYDMSVIHHFGTRLQLLADVKKEQIIYGPNIIFRQGNLYLKPCSSILFKNT